MLTIHMYVAKWRYICFLKTTICILTYSERLKQYPSPVKRLKNPAKIWGCFKYVANVDPCLLCTYSSKPKWFYSVSYLYHLFLYRWPQNLPVSVQMVAKVRVILHVTMPLSSSYTTTPATYRIKLRLPLHNHNALLWEGKQTFPSYWDIAAKGLIVSTTTKN